MHPAQQVGIVSPVRLAVGRGAGDVLMDMAHPVDGALRVLGGAVRGSRQERADALQPAPGIGAVIGVLRDRDHGQRVQGLEQQRAEAAGEHRGVTVDPPDGTVRREPARSGRAVEALAVSGALRAGDPGEELVADAPLQDVQADDARLRHGSGSLGWQAGHW
jgi:hypothetical protein